MTILQRQKKYQVSRKIIKPDTVLVSGPKSIIDTLKLWKTKPIKLRNISNNFIQDIHLESPEAHNIQLVPSKVTFELTTEEITGKRLKKPVKIINKPSNQRVLIYPRNVEISFQVSVNDYDEIDTTYFEVIADFNDYDTTKTAIPLRVNEQPRIHNVRLNPPEVDFILVK